MMVEYNDERFRGIRIEMDDAVAAQQIAEGKVVPARDWTEEEKHASLMEFFGVPESEWRKDFSA